MSHFKDHTGEVYGRLKVVEFIGKIGNQNTFWKCLCECGNYKTGTMGNLSKGHLKSCGCLLKEHRKNFVEKMGIKSFKGNGTAGFNILKRSYKSNAIERGLEYNLKDEDLFKIAKSNCFYCGIPPKQIKVSNSNTTTTKTLKKGQFIYNGIDRIDNDKGYIITNVVPCCDPCNHAKGTMSLKQFNAWIERLTTYRNKNV